MLNLKNLMKNKNKTETNYITLQIFNIPVKTSLVLKKKWFPVTSVFNLALDDYA